jgi:hypothetical protein
MVNDKSFILELKDDLNKQNRKEEFLKLYSSRLKQNENTDISKGLQGNYTLEGATTFRNRNQRSEVLC